MANRKPIPKSRQKALDEQLQPYDLAGLSKAEPKVDNRGTDVSAKGSRTKDVSIGIMDIDSAVIKYIEEQIQPAIIQDGERISVPLMYGYPERWNTMQEKGYLREYSGRMLTPVIVIKRDSIELNRTLGNKLDANNPHNFHVFEVPYTKKNAYDNFSVLTNRIPVKEYMAVATPDYVTLTYSCVVFTNHLEQNNKIIEAFNYAAYSYWGEANRFLFKAKIDTFTTSTEYSTDSDRTTRTNFTVTLNGYIIPDTVNRDLSYKKRYLSKAQVIFDLETENTSEIFKPTIGAKKKSPAIFPALNPVVSYVNTTDAVVSYLATMITKVANIGDIGNSSFSVGGVILQAPSPLPATSKDNFSVVINGQLVSNNFITSIDQVGNTVVVTIARVLAGYPVPFSTMAAAGATFIIIGKFQS
jgi:hypothetical protein